MSATAYSYPSWAPKHLGTIVAADGLIDAEIAVRIGIATHAFNQLSRQLLCNKHFPVKTRVFWYKTLIESKLYFGAGTWPTPTTCQLRRLHGVTLGFLRRVLRLPRDHEGHYIHRSAADIFHQAEVAAPRIRLALERLAHVSTRTSLSSTYVTH